VRVVKLQLCGKNGRTSLDESARTQAEGAGELGSKLSSGAFCRLAGEMKAAMVGCADEADLRRESYTANQEFA